MARKSNGMLARLRWQFVAIAMILTGTVLVAVLGISLFSTWRTQQDIIAEALDRAVYDDLNFLPQMGEKRGHPGDSGNHLLALAVDVSEDGAVIKTSRAPVAINATLLTEVVTEALGSENESGVIPDLHVAWKRRVLTEDEASASYWDDDEGEYALRIAIVDTTAMDSAFSEQLKSDAIIVVVALVALFASSWLLSSLALQPVQRAWDDQKRFIADASHELKTPLAVIIANTDILKADQGIPTESRRWVQSTADEAANMRGLVTDLLELARADEGATSGAMKHEDVDFSDVVDSTTLEFDALAFERGCLIEAEVQEGIHLQGDAEWLQRLTKILVDNACKYAAEGTTITVKLSKASGHVRLTVNNKGNVIDPEDLQHLFDRFYRSDKARNRATGGFGLGLAIAKGIAEAHGGTIAATSTANEGTTFTVTF